MIREEKKVLMSEQNDEYRNNVRVATNEEARYDVVVETLRRRMYRINKKIWESVDEDENDNVVVKLRDDIEEKVNLLTTKETHRRKKLLEEAFQEFNTKITHFIRVIRREEQGNSPVETKDNKDSKDTKDNKEKHGPIEVRSDNDEQSGDEEDNGDGDGDGDDHEEESAGNPYAD